MGKETIDFQPLLIGGLSDLIPETNRIGTIRAQIRTYGDLSEILVVGCEGLECRGNPSGAPPTLKNGCFEICSPRKVNRP